MKIEKLEEWWKFYTDKTDEENEKIIYNKLKKEYDCYTEKQYRLILIYDKNRKLESFEHNIGLVPPPGSYDFSFESHIEEQIKKYVEQYPYLDFKYIYLLRAETKRELESNIYSKYEHIIQAKKYNL